MKTIIISGGSGTRLWPLSRKKYPKQFCDLIGNQSLYQTTVTRNQTMCKEFIVVTNKDHYFVAKDEINKLDNCHSKFILEPVGRNTAPAIALACFDLNPDDIVLVTPADHYIVNMHDYEKTIKEGMEFAQNGYLVTFGIKPTYPEVGYGYIYASGNDVLSFKEKPTLEVAKVYLEDGNYLWNSGMFLFKVDTFLSELKTYHPEMFESCLQAYKNADKNENIKIHESDMMNIPSDSIDYAVMEKSSKIKVIPTTMEWTDLGSFESLYDALPKDEENNSTNKNYVEINSRNNLVITNDKVIATVDVEDLIIVDTDDALLITKKGSSQKIKDIMPNLEEVKPKITEVHTTLHRPWGKYIILEANEGYKIKKIIVKPGHQLMEHLHYHRNEHWTVLSGTAKVVIGSDSYLLRANESSYIPMGVEHQLINPGKIDLVMIETSVGSYLEEDDTATIDK